MISYSSSIIVETIYKCGGEYVPYGCNNVDEFGGDCCNEGCLNIGFVNIDSLASLDGYECETECCKPLVNPVCGDGILSLGEGCDDGN